MIKLVDVKDIPELRKRSWERKMDIEEFYKSNAKACEINTEGRSAESLAAVYRTTVRRTGYPIVVIRRTNRLFLIRTDIKE